MDAVTKNDNLLVDSNGNPKNGGYNMESMKQSRIIDFFKKMREKEFFEKGIQKKSSEYDLLTRQAQMAAR